MTEFKIRETERGYALFQMQEAWVGEFANSAHAEMLAKALSRPPEQHPSNTHERIEPVITDDLRALIVRLYRWCTEMSVASKPKDVAELLVVGNHLVADLQRLGMPTEHVRQTMEEALKRSMQPEIPTDPPAGTEDAQQDYNDHMNGADDVVTDEPADVATMTTTEVVNMEQAARVESIRTDATEWLTKIKAARDPATIADLLIEGRVGIEIVKRANFSPEFVDQLIEAYQHAEQRLKNMEKARIDADHYIATMQPLSTFSTTDEIDEEIKRITPLVDKLVPAVPSHADLTEKLTSRVKALAELRGKLMSGPIHDARVYLEKAAKGMRIDNPAAEIVKVEAMIKAIPEDCVELTRLRRLRDDMEKAIDPTPKTATPAPDWKNPAAKPESSSTQPKTADIVKMIDPVKGVAGHALATAIESAFGMKPAESLKAIRYLEEHGEIVLLRQLPDKSTRVFTKAAPNKAPMLDLEERVLDHVIGNFLTDADKQVCDVEVDKLTAMFKGSDKRDCVKMIDTLEEKGWLCVLYRSPARRLVRISPE